MLVCNNTLKHLGFMRKSPRYWQCRNGYELEENEHVSIFVSPNKTGLHEIIEFHVTFETRGHNLHFYFHEMSLQQWEAGGHTSSREIERLGLSLSELRRRAIQIADRFIKRIGGQLR